MRLGEDFERQLDEELGDCDAMVVVVGPGWLERIRRLKDPKDFVRREVEHALGRDIPVIPVLVGQVSENWAEQLPTDMQALAGRQWIELRDTGFGDDVQRLVRELKRVPHRGPVRDDTPTFTLSPKSARSKDLSPSVDDKYAFLWLDETFTIRGGTQYLAVADRPHRWICYYNVPIGDEFVLTDEHEQRLPIKVYRRNADPQRMEIFVGPLVLLEFDAPPCAPSRFHFIVTHRIERLLLPP
jgi:TIR domain